MSAGMRGTTHISDGTGFKIFLESGNITTIVQTDVENYMVTYPLGSFHKSTDSYVITWIKGGALEMFLNGRLLVKTELSRTLVRPTLPEHASFAFLQINNTQTRVVGIFLKFQTWRKKLTVKEIEDMYKIVGVLIFN